MGPDQIPAVLDLAEAKLNPGLAVLSAICHGQDKNVTRAVKIADIALAATRDLPVRHPSMYYFDLIQVALSPEVREALMMIPHNYQYQHEGLRSAHTEGKAEGKAEAIVDLLRARGLKITAKQEKQILACRDEELLRQWLVAASTATSVAAALKHG